MLVLERESPAQLDRVHPEALQQVFIHDGELLYRIVNADGFLRRAEKVSHLKAGHRFVRRASARLSE